MTVCEGHAENRRHRRIATRNDDWSASCGFAVNDPDFPQRVRVYFRLLSGSVAFPRFGNKRVCRLTCPRSAKSCRNSLGTSGPGSAAGLDARPCARSGCRPSLESARLRSAIPPWRCRRPDVGAHRMSSRLCHVSSVETSGLRTRSELKPLDGVRASGASGRGRAPSLKAYRARSGPDLPRQGSRSWGSAPREPCLCSCGASRGAASPSGPCGGTHTTPSGTRSAKKTGRRLAGAPATRARSSTCPSTRPTRPPRARMQWRGGRPGAP